MRRIYNDFVKKPETGLNLLWYLIGGTGITPAERIKSTMASLTPKEQKVLMMRFGLKDGRTHTLEETGKEFAVTRERIRQIESKSLEKIRSILV